MRTRILRTFVNRGLIDKDNATEMRAWVHDGGFLVDASVRIEGDDRRGSNACCATAPVHPSHWSICYGE